MRNLDFYKKRGYNLNNLNNDYIRWKRNPYYIQMIKYLNDID
jgi:hypothetical protein